MKAIPKIYRQGDILLISVSALPANAKDITPPDRIVLMLGEATGHAHAIERKDKMPARYFDAGAERFLQVLEKTALLHEEHSAIMLDKGIYRQVFQVEEKRAEITRVTD